MPLGATRNVVLVLATALVTTACLPATMPTKLDPECGIPVSRAASFSLQSCMVGASLMVAIRYEEIRKREKEKCKKKSHCDNYKKNIPEKLINLAAMSCLASASVGYVVGKNVENMANKQKQKECEIKRNQFLINDLKITNQQIRENINNYKKEIRQLKSLSYDHQTQQEELQRIKKAVDKQHRELQTTKSSVEGELKTLKAQSQTAKDKQQLSAQIRAIESEYQLLAQSQQELSALSNSFRDL